MRTDSLVANDASTGVLRVLIVATVVSALGGFLFGYDNIVISGAIGHLAQYFGLSSAGIGWAAGCALIGCLIGSATAGAVADFAGLRRALYGCSLCFGFSALGLLFAHSFSQYAMWRILGGVGIGAASIVAPMYIAEIAPARIRGRLVVFYQLGIVAGILCSVFVNMLIERAGPADWQVRQGWRWMFAAAAIPALLFAMTIATSRESPRWLMKVGREQEAEKVLAEINGQSSARLESDAIRHSLAEEASGVRELFAKALRPALLMGFLIAAFSQTSGITCLLSYLPEVFKSAGQNAANAFFQSFLVGVVNLIFTILALWLVDRAGRKTLILTGTAVQTVALLAIAGLFRTGGDAGRWILVGIMAFVAAHAIGNGAVCWVIISEIFPTKVRGVAMSIATTALWIFAYLANQFFPIMQSHFNSDGTFLVFAVMAALNFLFVWQMVPETKGYSLEQISEMWLHRAAVAGGKTDS